jgi:hypothetical protein
VLEDRTRPSICHRVLGCVALAAAPLLAARRGFGASHIKRIADRMVAGVSITVDYPPEFDRIEQQDQQRFLSWTAKPEGAAAIKKQKRQ